MTSQALPFLFPGLPSFTREEVRLWNWYCRFFPDLGDWRSWAAQVFGQLLEAPAGEEIRLRQGNSLEPQQGEKTYTFAKAEICFGRDPDNDVALPSKAIARRHARLFSRSGQIWLEDLGSSPGAYVRNKKVPPGQPQALENGDSFIIFPYTFTVEAGIRWRRESRVELSPARVEGVSWGSFLAGAAVDSVSFRVGVHPTGGAACLEVNRRFLEEVLIRMLKPAGLEPGAPGMTAWDEDLFEFLVLALLERAQQDLAFPFQFAQGPGGSRPECLPPDRGLALCFSVGLTQLTGAFRVFLPFGLLESMQQAAPTGAQPSLPRSVSWRFPVSAGYVELTAEEIGRLEPADILLFIAAPALLWPANPGRGWKASLAADNPWRVVLDNYFERSLRMPDGADAEADGLASGSPDLGQLPIRVQVILGEHELTLGEVNSLAPGTILELNAGKSDPVGLAVNGKLIGQGELVEVSGKLGVKILGWRTV